MSGIAPGRLGAVTPAIRALRAAGVAFGVHEYERGDDLRDFGREAATALGIEPDQVFKTLIVDADGDLAVAVVPVSCSLSMKAVAAALGAKRADLADVERAQRSSGYVVGGISPIGQKRALPTVLDESVDLFERVYVSGGRRGLDVSLAPGDLARVTGARVAAITA